MVECKQKRREVTTEDALNVDRAINALMMMMELLPACPLIRHWLVVVLLQGGQSSEHL